MTITERLSPNRGLRPAGVTIGCVVIHDTGSRDAESALSWFDSPASRVSAHYVIDRDGAMWRCVPEAEQAWHAGTSVLHGIPNLNAWSIGLELVDKDDGESYPAAQMAAVAELTADICNRYAIPLNRIIGHADIATPRGRKVDPGGDFAWDAFLLDVAARRLGVAKTGG